jgi:hypothetical protein
MLTKSCERVQKALRPGKSGRASNHAFGIDPALDLHQIDNPIVGLAFQKDIQVKKLGAVTSNPSA